MKKAWKKDDIVHKMTIYTTAVRCTKQTAVSLSVHKYNATMNATRTLLRGTLWLSALVGRAYRGPVISNLKMTRRNSYKTHHITNCNGYRQYR